jgi:DNA-binding NarL/FixJ family response regulator
MATPPRVLLALEGDAAAGSTVARVIAELQAAGHVAVQPQIDGPAPRRAIARTLEVVVVSNREDAAQAVHAALDGCSVLVIGRGDRALLDRLYDDLRRFGRLAVRSQVPHDTSDGLAPEGRALLELLRDGMTLGEAARTLHVSRRTADRRLAEVRRVMGVDSTLEAIARLGSKLVR